MNGGGNDRLYAGSASSVLLGREGRDYLYGGAAGDLLSQTVDRGLLASDIAHAVPQALAQIVEPVE